MLGEKEALRSFHTIGLELSAHPMFALAVCHGTKGNDSPQQTLSSKVNSKDIGTSGSKRQAAKMFDCTGVYVYIHCLYDFTQPKHAEVMKIERGCSHFAEA